IRSFDSGKVEIYGPDTINNGGNNALYTVWFNFEQTGATLAVWGDFPNGSWLFGLHRHERPFMIFIASDIAAHFGNNDHILVIATQLHELAHAVAHIGG